MVRSFLHVSLCQCMWNKRDERKENTHGSLSYFGAGRVSMLSDVNKHSRTYQVTLSVDRERIIVRGIGLRLNLLPGCWQNRGQRGCL